MNNAGLIVLALLGGALVVLLILGMAMLAWSLWQVWKRVEADAALRKTQMYDLDLSLGAAKSSFASIRTEMTRQQGEFLRDTGKMLETYSGQMAESIAKINAQALEAASMRGLQACIRMEKVAVAMQKLLLTVDVPEENNFAPEEYAPDDNTIYSRQSDVARGDAEADAEDAEGTFTLR